VNAGRFAILQPERSGATPETHPASAISHPLDVDFAARLAALVERATASFRDFDFASALHASEEAFWDFCDNYLEIVKVRAYAEALVIYRGWYGDNHFETAATLTMIGRALIPQGRLDEAKEPLRQALAIRERVYGPDHPSVASTLNELAKIAQQEGRLDEAEAGFRRMMRIYQTAFHDKHYLIGLAISNLGGVQLDRGDNREAERLFREALRRYGETLPADHLYAGIARIKRTCDERLVSREDRCIHANPHGQHQDGQQD
jgi:tetratricopeptide (TPR) repeat protein